MNKFVRSQCLLFRWFQLIDPLISCMPVSYVTSSNLVETWCILMFCVYADSSCLSKSLQEFIHLSLSPRWQNITIWWCHSVFRWVRFDELSIGMCYFHYFIKCLTWPHRNWNCSFLVVLLRNYTVECIERLMLRASASIYIWLWNYFELVLILCFTPFQPCINISVSKCYIKFSLIS